MRYTFPKIDLHLHLDGALSPSLAFELAKERNISLPADTADELASYMVISKDNTSLYEFLKRFDLPIALLQDEDAMTRAVYELITRLAKQNLRYMEIRFAPQHHTLKGMSQKQAVEAALRGRAKALEDCDIIDANLILCAMTMGDRTDDNANRETMLLVHQLLGQGVCAFDLAGAEGMLPMAHFAPLFAEAQQLGVPFTIHAGESTGWQTIADALQFSPKRIGHGRSSIESSELMAELKARNIPLELCVTSNVQCCCVESYAAHPLRKLYEAGIATTINTDNMTISNTSLDQEYEKIERYLGLSIQDIVQMNRNAVQYAFLEDAKKQLLMMELDAVVIK